MSEKHNNTVGIERVNGEMMVIEHRDKKQVGALKGEILDLAVRNYPSEAMLKDAAFVEPKRKQLEHYLEQGNFDAFNHTSDMSLSDRSLNKRGVCGGCPFIIISCPWTPKCLDGSICVLVLCFGDKAPTTTAAVATTSLAPHPTNY